MKKTLAIALLTIAWAVIPSAAADNTPSATKSTRKERLLIKEGNKLYKEGKYTPAAQKYVEALKENPMSVAAVYDLGLTRIRQGAAKGESDENREKLTAEGSKYLETAAAAGQTNPKIAAKAAYNLGNLAFNSQKYDVAVQQYKRSLRLDPEDDDARRNLRIAQKKLQNQDKKDDKQDQKQDKQQQQQDQNKDQNKEQNQDKQDQQQDQQQQQQPQSRINEQTAAQILQAVENKENATRARVAGQGDKSQGRPRGKNW